MQVNLYAKPAKSGRVVAKLSLRQHLVPIYRQGKWVKVGNPQDGKVGWLNVPDYYQAFAGANGQQKQTVYIKSAGKPGSETIIAYENGKRVGDKRARKLYKELLTKQKQDAAQMFMLQRHIDKMLRVFSDDYGQDMLMQPPFPRFPVIPPIVIVVKSES